MILPLHCILASRLHFKLFIFYLLVLVVLSSITKKGEIVRKMDLGPFNFGFWCLMNNITKLD